MRGGIAAAFGLKNDTYLRAMRCKELVAVMQVFDVYQQGQMQGSMCARAAAWAHIGARVYRHHTGAGQCESGVHSQHEVVMHFTHYITLDRLDSHLRHIIGLLCLEQCLPIIPLSLSIHRIHFCIASTIGPINPSTA